MSKVNSLTFPRSLELGLGFSKGILNLNLLLFVNEKTTQILEITVGLAACVSPMYNKRIGWNGVQLEPRKIGAIQSGKGGTHMMSPRCWGKTVEPATLDIRHRRTKESKRPEDNFEVKKSWVPTLLAEGCVVSTSSTKPGVSIAWEALWRGFNNSVLYKP